MSKEAMKLALEKYMSAFGQALEAHGIPFQEQQIMADRQAREALAQSQSDVKQEPKPFGYTLEETMKCWDLGYAAAVKALAKQEQPYADKAASVSNDRIKIDSVTGNVQIGTAKQEKSKECVGEPDDLTIAYMSGLHRGKDLAQQRTWVGLTDDDKCYLNEVLNLQGRFPVIDAIEAKLREKNSL